MKKLTLAVLLLYVSFPAFPQQEKRVESSISGVTVFLSKAQVTRKVKTRVEAGKSNVIITGLTSQLDQESIQVTGKGAFIILGISHEQNYLSEFNTPAPLKSLRDSVEMLQRQLAIENSQKEILVREEQMLLANQKLANEKQSFSVAELRAMADFYRARMGELIVAKMRQDEKIGKLNEKLVKIQRQLSEKMNVYSKNTSEIIVSISAEAATSVELDVTYIVSNAGWYPVYDLRAMDTKSPVQLSYKANVFQTTGEEWQNVRLNLSTANPALGGLKPELATWFLDFYTPVTYRRERDDQIRKKAEAPAAMERAQMAPEEVAVDATSTADYVSTVQTAINTEFDISLPYTVRSSGKPTLVDIRRHELSADYIYSAAPKLDRDAFLVARVTGWEEFSLLPGEANMFFEGTFVGKTYIDPNSIRDTLSLSLGRDKRVVIKREKLKDFSSKKLIGTNQRNAYAFEISVRNAKAEPVKIIIEDQVPVSRNNQIEVTMVDSGNAAFNSVSGKLTWKLDLAAGETKKVSYRYEVKYPKDQAIAGLE